MLPSSRRKPSRCRKTQCGHAEIRRGKSLAAFGNARRKPAKPSGRHSPSAGAPVKRKIAKGRLALEARIDLHGMIQSEAHVLLLDFLIRAYERGMRHVLVITGKGSSLCSDGALKRAVPMWFSQCRNSAI
jgi:DNA-nicking Smr family endonuclease